MSNEFAVTAIGRVVSGRDEPIDDGWDAIPVRIDLDATQFTADALLSLEQFSHAEIVYLFDRVGLDQIERGARHPRARTD